MNLHIEEFNRKPFTVQAVRVTKANILEVAKWCSATVKNVSAEDSTGRNQGDQYLLVNVTNPASPRQTKAFVGDWVVFAGHAYRCYTDKAFRKAFDLARQRPRTPLPTGLTATIVDDGAVGTDEQLNNIFDSQATPAGAGANANPGGTHTV